MRRTRSTKIAALGLGLMMAAGTFAAPAWAADDDKPLDSKILDTVLQGIGLKKDGEAAIDYQERAPLVIPQRLDLPAPERSDVAVTNPAWPKDPDIARRREEDRRNRNRNVSDEREREMGVLRESELAPGATGRRTASAGRRDDGYRAPDGDFANPMKPSDLGYRGGIFGSMFGAKDETEVGRFTGEPPRASLTAPPRGYQTPSPDQPYGVGKAKPKPTDFYGTHGEVQSGR